MKKTALETQNFILNPDCILRQEKTKEDWYWHLWGFFLQFFFHGKPISKTSLRVPLKGWNASVHVRPQQQGGHRWTKQAWVSLTVWQRRTLRSQGACPRICVSKKWRRQDAHAASLLKEHGLSMPVFSAISLEPRHEAPENRACFQPLSRCWASLLSALLMKVSWIADTYYQE